MYYQVTLFFFLASEISGKFRIFPKVSNLVQYGGNKLCRLDSDIYRKSLGNYTIWAHKMLDSSAKGTFGVLQGNEQHLGNYEECLNIHGPFPTQYCLVGLTVNVPQRNSTERSLQYHHNQYGTVFTKFEHHKVKNIKLGLCVPLSCSASDIQASLTETLKKVDKPFKSHGITYTATSSPKFCSNYTQSKKFGALEIAFCTITVTLIIFVLIGTLSDCLKIKEHPTKHNFFKKLCVSFSARKNWNELFTSRGEQEETKIFDGVRSICTLIVFIGHCAVCIAIVPNLNGLAIDEIYNSRLVYAIESADLVVDIFFVMSGLLMVLGILNKWKTANVNPIWLIFLRYMRLTPVNFYTSLCFATMLTYFGSGPVWNFAYIAYIQGCRKNNYWWLNIFYINNFVEDSNQTCNFMAWFVACDFQLFIMGVFVMFVMKKNLRLGYAILGVIFILSIISTFTLTEVYNIVPHMGIHGSDGFKKFLNIYYIKPYNRASSYTVGMLGGIIYDKLKLKEAKISKMQSTAVIGISLVVMAASYAYFIFAYNGQENYMFEFALYNTLHRPIWCMGLLGIFIITSFGSLPTMRRFLSSSFWAPLAKLSYGFYLIHFMAQITIVTTSATVIRTRILNMASLCIALFAVIIILSLLMYVILEAPLLRISKIVFLPKSHEGTSVKPRSEKSETVEESAVAEIN